MYCVTEKEIDTNTERCLTRICFYSDRTETHETCTNLDICYNLIHVMFFSLFGISFLILLKNSIDYYIAKHNLPLISYSVNNYKYMITSCFVVLLITNSAISLLIINLGPLRDWEDPSKKHVGYNCILWTILTTIVSGSISIYLFSIILFSFCQILLELYKYRSIYNRTINEEIYQNQEV